MSKMTKSQMIESASDLVDVAKTSENVVVFIPSMEEVSEKENMHNEFDLLGYFVSKHPLDDYKTKISQLDQIGELSELREGTRVHLGGILSAFRPTRTKKGDNMAFATLEDNTGRIEVIIFSSIFARAEHFLAQNALVEIKGKIEIDEKEVNGELIRKPKLIASFIHPLENVEQLKKISLKVLQGDNLKEIEKILKERRGDLPVDIEYENFSLETSYRIPQTIDLINSLKAYCLVKEIQV